MDHIIQNDQSVVTFAWMAFLDSPTQLRFYSPRSWHWRKKISRYQKECFFLLYWIKSLCVHTYIKTYENMFCFYNWILSFIFWLFFSGFIEGLLGFHLEFFSNLQLFVEGTLGIQQKLVPQWFPLGFSPLQFFWIWSHTWDEGWSWSTWRGRLQW